ncbi:MAG: ABC transporter permease [Anaerolineaceae bacterium]|nr:ABC transporter permease [Anaerolineaceae bacterium]
MNLSPRWRKVLADLWSNKVRTLLVVASIAVGVFAVGMVSITFDILMNDMDTDYQSSNPYHAEMYTNYLDTETIEVLEKIEGVGVVEGRGSINADVELADGEWKAIDINSVPDVSKMKIGVLRPEIADGPLNLGRHQIFIERTALSVLNVKPGDVIRVKLMDDRIKELEVAAVVHDVTSYPMAFTDQVTAYVNQDTMVWLGGGYNFSQVLLTVSENATDEQHVREVAEAVGDKLEKGGNRVYYTSVYEPGKHFASSITGALGVIMSFLGVMAVMMSGFLVINTITALLSQHISQIGIMKTIGAERKQVLIMYLVLVVSFGVLAFIIAVPLSALIGYGISSGVAVYLNFDLQGFRIPLLSIVLELIVAIIVPLLAALVPVLNGSRITIREAFDSYGLSKPVTHEHWIDRLLNHITFLSRPLIISIRNTFRRKARLMLTLITLTLGGAIFIGVFNVKASLYKEIDDVMGYFISDVNIRFNNYYRHEEVFPVVEEIQGVEIVEGWGVSMGEVFSGGNIAEQIIIYAPPAGSQMIEPNIVSGRWLIPEDENAIVIGNHFLAKFPDYKVGDTLTIKIENKDYDWKVVGIYNMAGTVIPPILYGNYGYLASTMGMVEKVSEIRIQTAYSDAINQRIIGEEISAALESVDVPVANMQIGDEMIRSQNASIDVLINFLLVMAVIIAIVGGLGLMGLMSMNVLERTREIGVMRSIGAADGSIIGIVIVEGVTVGLISMILGAILAIPISQVLDVVVGNAFIESPVAFVYSLEGILYWMILIVVLSVVASILPARNAVRLTIRDVLAYE